MQANNFTNMKAVILAGGVGTRLWPLSTSETPKQFQKLVSNKTMIEETINRLDFLAASDIYLAINAQHYKLVRKLCPEIPKRNIIIEPALRDTAPCIGLAAAIIEKRHPEEAMAIIYADHLIKNKKEFQDKLKVAEKLSQKDNTLNIIEVEATEPNTNYGYVKIGKEIEKIDGTSVYELDSFTEKPDVETAKKFLKSKKYLWNTGIYVWRAKDLMNQYKKLQPSMYKKLVQIQKDYCSQTQDATLNAIYPDFKKISIDYAIMEKINTKEVRILKANLGWSDIGTWEAIWEELPKNNIKNITRGKVTLLDCKESLIYGDSEKKICIIGLDDIVVIDTDEGLLIAKKDQSKRVKGTQ